MKRELFYVTTTGDKDRTNPTVLQVIYKALQQEEACIPLPEQNWIVLSTAKNIDILCESINGSIFPYSIEIQRIEANIIDIYREENVQLQKELHETRNTLLDLMEKNGALIEENTTLRLAQQGTNP